jgi:hypothetical protein
LEFLRRFCCYAQQLASQAEAAQLACRDEVADMPFTAAPGFSKHRWGIDGSYHSDIP